MGHHFYYHFIFYSPLFHFGAFSYRLYFSLFSYFETCMQAWRLTGGWRCMHDRLFFYFNFLYSDATTYTIRTLYNQLLVLRILQLISKVGVGANSLFSNKEYHHHEDYDTFVKTMFWKKLLLVSSVIVFSSLFSQRERRHSKILLGYNFYEYPCALVWETFGVCVDNWNSIIWSKLRYWKHVACPMSSFLCLPQGHVPADEDIDPFSNH